MSDDFDLEDERETGVGFGSGERLKSATRSEIKNADPSDLEHIEGSRWRIGGDDGDPEIRRIPRSLDRWTRQKAARANDETETETEDGDGGVLARARQLRRRYQRDRHERQRDRDQERSEAYRSEL